MKDHNRFLLHFFFSGYTWSRRFIIPDRMYFVDYTLRFWEKTNRFYHMIVVSEYIYVYKSIFDIDSLLCSYADSDKIIIIVDESEEYKFRSTSRL